MCLEDRLPHFIVINWQKLVVYPVWIVEKMILHLPDDSSPVFVSCFCFLRRFLHFRAIEQSERNNLFANQSWQRVAYISNVHSHRDVISFFSVSCQVENLISPALSRTVFYLWSWYAYSYLSASFHNSTWSHISYFLSVARQKLGQNGLVGGGLDCLLVLPFATF